ncbi:MAG: hypothetical protein HOF23_09885 [Rhodospirillaceae bacterium]|nr:hypothetical protein [Rhodospirillaceae bacterium]
MPNSFLKFASLGPDRSCLAGTRWIAATLLVIFVSSEVIAQVLPNTAANRRRGVAGCTQTRSGITCPGGGGGGGGGGYSGYNANTMMMGVMGNAMNSFMQGYQRGLAIRARKQKGNRLNDRGLQYERQKNWSSAASSYRQALQYWNHPTIVSNLRRVEDELSGAGDRRRKAERRRRAQLAAKRKSLQAMIGNLANSLGQGGTLSSTPDDDLGFVQPGGTAFFGAGGGSGGSVETKTSPDENGLSFMGPKDQYFSKGTKYSATTDLRDSASDQLAVTRDRQLSGKPVEEKGGLDFYQPSDKVKGAGQAGLAPGKPIPVKRQPTSRKAELLLDSLEYGGRDWQRSRDYLLKKLKDNPTDRDVRAALQNLNEAQMLANKLERVKRQEMTEKIIGEALMASLHGDEVTARDKFAEALKLSPNDTGLQEVYQDVQVKLTRKANILARKGLLAGDRGDDLKERAYFQKALKLSPNDTGLQKVYQDVQVKLTRKANILARKGLLAGDRGDYIKERAYFQKALTLNPNDDGIKAALEVTQKNLDAQAEKLLAKGLTAGFQGNALKEVELYKQAYIRKPYDASIKEVLIHAQKTLNDEAHALTAKGVEVSHFGNEQRALIYFKQALLRRPHDQGIKDVIKRSEEIIAKQQAQKTSK